MNICACSRLDSASAEAVSLNIASSNRIIELDEEKNETKINIIYVKLF